LRQEVRSLKQRIKELGNENGAGNGAYWQEAKRLLDHVVQEYYANMVGAQANETPVAGRRAPDRQGVRQGAEDQFRNEDQAWSAAFKWLRSAQELGQHELQQASDWYIGRVNALPQQTPLAPCWRTEEEGAEKVSAPMSEKHASSRSPPLRRDHPSKSGPMSDEHGKNGAQLISMKEHRLTLEQWRAEHEAEIAREVARERAACQEQEMQRAAEVAAQHASGLEVEVRSRLGEAAMEQQHALDKQRLELTGEANGQVAAMERQIEQLQAAAAEKAALEEAKLQEERVEIMRRQAMRRLHAVELARGWSAWLEAWEVRRHALDLLHRCGTKLRAPSLHAAFTYWISAHESEKAEAAYEASLRQNTSLEGALRVAQYEMSQLRLVTKAKEDEALGLTQRVAELTAEVSHKAGLLVSAAELRRQHSELVEMYREAQEEQVAAERRAAYAESEGERHRVGSEELLGKLLKEQRQAFDAETAGLREALATRTEDEQREMRMEHLRKTASRRLLYAGLQRGWEAWEEYAEGRLYSQAVLKQVGSRMQIRGVAGAFTAWSRVVKEERLMMMNLSSNQKLKLAESAISKLDRQVAQLQSELTEVTSHRDQLQAKVRELSGGSEDVQALLHEQEVGERQRRLEAFGQQALRRMVHNDVRRGWTAWRMHSESSREAHQLIYRTARRLCTAVLGAAFNEWRAEVEAGVALHSKQEIERRYEELEAEYDEERRRGVKLKAELEAEIAASVTERAEALERQRIELSGTQQEREALLEQEAKHARVEQMRRWAGRKLMHTGMADGWCAWIEFCEAKRDAIQRLKRAAVRLRAPDLTHAFWVWADLLEEKRERQRRKQLTGMQKREAELLDQCVQLEHQMEVLRSECDARLLKAAKEHESALGRQLVELTGAAGDVAAMREEQAKEARILEMHGRAAKRMGRRGLSRSFETWLNVYEERQRAMTRLRACSNRLRTPVLAAAWTFWVHDLKKTIAKAAMDAIVAQSQSVEAQLRQARYEGKQLSIIRVAQDDESRLLREQVGELTKKTAEQAEMIARLVDLPAELERLRVVAATAEATAHEAVEKRTQAEADVLQQLDTSKALLQRLLKEQKERLLENEQMKLADYERKCKQQAAEIVKLQEAAHHLVVKKLPSPKEPLKKKMPAAGTFAPGMIDLDEGPDAPPYAEQLATALRENSARVLDLFRSWDSNGDGQVSRAEFHKAMPALGLEVPKKDIDELFSEWDADGGGNLAYGELVKILRKRTPGGSTAAVMALNKIKKATA